MFINLSILLCNYKRLFAEDFPCQRHFEIDANQERKLREPALCRVWQKSGYGLFYCEPCSQNRLCKTFVRQRDTMVKKIPVLSIQVTDIGLKNYYGACWFKHAPSFPERLHNLLSGFEMFQKITHKYNIYRFIGNWLYIHRGAGKYLYIRVGISCSVFI